MGLPTLQRSETMRPAIIIVLALIVLGCGENKDEAPEGMKYNPDKALCVEAARQFHSQGAGAAETKQLLEACNKYPDWVPK